MDERRILEELLLYAILYHDDIITEEVYQNKLDSLFLENPDNEILLDLEWETDIQKVMVYIQSHIDYDNIDCDRFEKAFLERLQEYYDNCPDLKCFADKMYHLWSSLPSRFQYEEPFSVLCYADDPLSWGDEEQTRALYEWILNHYKNKICK